MTDFQNISHNFSSTVPQLIERFIILSSIDFVLSITPFITK